MPTATKHMMYIECLELSRDVPAHTSFTPGQLRGVIGPGETAANEARRECPDPKQMQWGKGFLARD